MLPRTVLWFVFTTLTSAQTCYWRNGGAQEDLKYQPCSNDTSDPMSHVCCKINVDNPDTCLPNGLCKTGEIYFRESCTLQDWEAGGCQDICSSSTDQRKTDVNVTPCDGTDTSEYWCCGNTLDCCANSSIQRYRVDRIFMGVVTSSLLSSSTSTSIPPSSSSSSSASTPSSASTSSPTMTLPNNDSAGLSTGAKAGIGVGAAFGVIALIGLGVFLGRRSRNKRNEVTEATSYYGPVQKVLPPAYTHEAPMHEASMHEAPPTHTPIELAGDQIKPQEMPGHGR